MEEVRGEDLCVSMTQRAREVLVKYGEAPLKKRAVFNLEEHENPKIFTE